MSNFVDCNKLADFLDVDGIDLFDNPGARCLSFSKKWSIGSMDITFIEHENIFSISYEINGNNLFSARIDDVLDIKNNGGDIEIISKKMKNLILSKIDRNFLLTFKF